MKNLKIALIVGFLTLGIVSAQAAEINAPAPGFSLPDPEGEVYQLSDFEGMFVVLEWINFDCPFVRKHYDSGNMQKVQEQMADEGVAWFAINSSAPGKQGHFEIDELKARIDADQILAAAYLLDASGDVGRAYEAQTTPHLFLIDPQGVLIYQGAIDSKSGTDSAEILEAENYLLRAYEEAKAGQPVSLPQTKAYGCSVKY